MNTTFCKVETPMMIFLFDENPHQLQYTILVLHHPRLSEPLDIIRVILLFSALRIGFSRWRANVHP
jgi:hypothetical protein